MGLFDKFKSKDFKDNPFVRKGEEALYRQAMNEIESGSINKGVYAKALADSEGNEDKVRSLYLKYRVQSILDERVLDGIREREKEQKRKDRWHSFGNFIWAAILILFLIYLSTPQNPSKRYR